MTHLLLALLFATAPSRAAQEGCKWEKLSDPQAGVEAWVQRCNFGDRKIDFFAKDRSLFMRYSDGGKPDAVVDVIDLLPGETAEAGLKRIFAARTPKSLASRCVLAPFHGNDPTPAGVKRFTFVPDAKYKKELDAKNDSGDIPEPPCGAWGDQPDDVEYFETQSGARKVLYVRWGQDTPLFDDATLHILK